ncbi:hypothetical protein [Clostridium luticellarii]|jgi:hypothetical protein|uniref:Uncharacterized protein n=1 Tax=Clostridium luticellarii TaxID=1691940 RepID=A0A2T0BLI6_9CLOT|nr:hypothetical protein [Clostridium luticellarii]PRR84737.1 hypothetical protein CLLU_22760 [Clostridium luticellarii]
MLNEQIIISGNIAVIIPATDTTPEQNKIVGNMSSNINSGNGTVSMTINLQDKDTAQANLPQVQQQVQEFMDAFKTKTKPIIDLFGDETTTTTTEAPTTTTITTQGA